MLRSTVKSSELSSIAKFKVGKNNQNGKSIGFTDFISNKNRYK